jgi:hypothetical protein
MNLQAKLQRAQRSDLARQRPATGKHRHDRTVLVEVGRRNWRSRWWVCTPPSKNPLPISGMQAYISYLLGR